jgi:hypothetical protein
MLDAWGILFRSRDKLLIRVYRDSIRATEPEADVPTTLGDARQQWDRLQEGLDTSDAARDDRESRIVLNSRIAAAWMVFWSTILPAGIASYAIERISRAYVLNVSNLLYGAIVFFFLFWILCFISLFIQALFLRPFIAIVNRLVPPVDETGRLTSTKEEPGNPVV